MTPNSKEAELEAIKLADSNPEYTLIHPYDDEDLWLVFSTQRLAFHHEIILYTRDGYSTIIDEIKKQLNGKIPSCMLLSVGGGGMLLGFMTGLKRHGK